MATLGILAVSVGAKTPVVIIADLLQMFPTARPWTSKALGPYIGWRGIPESAHAQMAKHEHLLK
jgi:hypothetical protein